MRAAFLGSFLYTSPQKCYNKGYFKVGRFAACLISWQSINGDTLSCTAAGGFAPDADGRRYHSCSAVPVADRRHRPSHHGPRPGPVQRGGCQTRPAILGRCRSAGQRPRRRTLSRQPEKPQKIDLASLNDPYVAVLCEEAQTAFGKALSRSEMQRFGRPVPDRRLAARRDSALLRRGRPPGTAHHRRRCPRELVRWREAGVETGEDAERWLQRCQAARALVCQDAAAAVWHCSRRALTNWERRAIARWHEEMGHRARDDRRGVAACQR